LGVFVLLIWALTTPGEYFWPSWVWLGLLIPFAVAGSIRNALRAPRRRAFQLQFNVSVVVMGILIWVWLMTFTAYPWPLWPLFGLSVALFLHALAFPAAAGAREQDLTERVGAWWPCPTCGTSSGIAQRLDPFDGTVSVVSPPGGPTVVRVEIPCSQSPPKV
jgi:hypothetical protein